MIDNCYCEFVDTKEPIEVGTDIIVGSLIKNLGGGIAPNGAYVAGKRELIKLVSERLTVQEKAKKQVQLQELLNLYYKDYLWHQLQQLQA